MEGVPSPSSSRAHGAGRDLIPNLWWYRRKLSSPKVAVPQSEEAEVVVQDPGLVVEEPPKWAARPMLHGVSAVGGKRQGVMTVFEGKQKTGELRNVEVGDLVQGYWVDEIGETTLRLRWGDRDEIIDMADATKPAAAGRSGAAGKGDRDPGRCCSLPQYRREARPKSRRAPVLKCPWLEHRPVKEVVLRGERHGGRGLLSQPVRELSKMTEFRDSLKAGKSRVWLCI